MNHETIKLLKETPIFAGLSVTGIERLADLFQDIDCPPGSTIFEEGKPGECLLLIKSGNVEITKNGPGSERPIHLALRGPGEIIGEMAIIEDSTRFATARAIDAVKLLSVSKDNFKKLLKENPIIAYEIMSTLSSRLRQSDLQMIADLERVNNELKTANHELNIITEELKKSNLDLQKAKTFREKIIFNSPFFILATDPSGSIVLMNGSAEKVFGCESEKYIGRHISEVINIAKGQGLFSDIIGVLESGNVWKRNLITLTSDNSQIIIELTALRVEGVGHSGVENIADLYMGRDITEEKNMERQAFQLERMATRGEMAAEVAHELNNYLSIVSGNLELLDMAMSRGQHDQVPKRSSSMREGLTKITLFVEGLMGIARPEAKIEIFDLHQFIDSELFFLKPQPRFRDIEFALRLGNDIPLIEADRSQLQQVLFNLFLNASDALAEIPPGKRRITIYTTYSKDDDMVKVSVGDNGCGMSDIDYQRAFRQHFTTKKAGKGFGLLAVKRAIRSHGGRVSVARGPEGGASFSFEIPRRQSAGQPKPSQVPA